jgi:hypothetical protein
MSRTISPMLLPVSCLVCCLAVAGAAHAAPTLQDVRRAPSLRAALRLAKKLPAVRAALARGRVLTLAEQTPTESSISAGKVKSVLNNRFEMAGMNAVLQLRAGLFGPKVEVRARPLWVYGYVASARMPATREPSATHLVTEMLRAQKGEILWKGKELPGSDVLVRGDGWQMQWTRERRFRVPTWRPSKTVARVQGTWQDLTPQTLADALARVLAAPTP